MKGQVTLTPREVKYPIPAFSSLFPFEAEPFDAFSKFFNAITRRGYEMLGTPGINEQSLHVPVEIAETEKELLITAEVAGFTDKDLEVRVEPTRLFITGKTYDNKEEKGKKTLYTERSYNQLFRYVDLPIQVNPDNATATVKDGVLKITLFKAKAPKLIPVNAIS